MCQGRIDPEHFSRDLCHDATSVWACRAPGKEIEEHGDALFRKTMQSRNAVSPMKMV